MNVRVGSVPVFIHWSVLATAGVLAILAGVIPSLTCSFSFAFVVMLGFHEAAHAMMARAHGLTVFSVRVTWLGGECRNQVPASYRAAFLVASAGLLVHAAFVLVIVGTSVTRTPMSPVVSRLGGGFLYANAVMLIMNVIPQKRRLSHLHTDGYLLWMLAISKFRHRPYAWPDTSPVIAPKTRLTELKGFTPDGFRTGIEILNDNATPMEFVVAALTNGHPLICRVVELKS